MRTLIIAPSFLTVFTVAIFSLGWLVTQCVNSTAAINGVNPPPWAFTGWAYNYPAGDAMPNLVNTAVHEQIEELSLY